MLAAEAHHQSVQLAAPDRAGDDQDFVEPSLSAWTRSEPRRDLDFRDRPGEHRQVRWSRLNGPCSWSSAWPVSRQEPSSRRGSSAAAEKHAISSKCGLGHSTGSWSSRRCGYTAIVTAVPIRTAKDKLSALVDRVEGTHERVTITRNGTPVAVLVSPDDLEALEETLDVLSDADLMAQLRQSQDELRRGDTYSEAELRELMAQRRRAE